MDYDKLTKMIDEYWASPQSDIDLKEFVKKQDDMVAFVNTDEFTKAFEIIKTHDRIGEEELAYGIIKIEGLDAKLFVMVVDTLMANREATEDDDLSFRNDSVDYKGVRFTRMYGQGTAYWSTKL